MHNTLKIHDPPKYVKINTLNIEAMENVKLKIKSDDVYDRINKSPSADQNFNYDILYEEIICAKNKNMPNKLAKFNKYKHKKLTWITQI